MNKILAPLMAAACVLTALPASAEVKIGFVNSQRVLNDAPQASKAKKKIEKEFEKRDQDLQKLAKQLQALQEALGNLPESERRSKEREFAEHNRDFQRKQREFKEDLNLRQNEEMAAIYERVNKVIKGIAETEKYDIILQEAVYFNSRIDLTDRIIKALGDGSK